tara:strand:- start:673 stop:1275 length:603 start_codon:yes stop_codon:yes gene_type:complete
MTKRLFFLVSIFCLYLNPILAVTYNSDPKIFVQELVDDAVKALSDKSLNEEEKNEVIKKIALENVDIKALGLYTLGSIRKDLDENTLNKYQVLFQKYFLKSLTSRLTDYSSQKFEVFDSDQKSSNYTIVNSKIPESLKSPEIKIDWRVYTKNPEKPLIRDLIVEGLSLARTQKEEFASILNSNNNDINALIQKLREFVSN